MNLTARIPIYITSAILAFICSTSGNSALAAAALAGGSTGYTYASTNNDSLAEAEKDAMEQCSLNSTKCSIMSSFTGAAALALAKGIDGKAVVVNQDPKLAARMAVASCAKKFKNCRLTAIYWEDGARWASFARARKADDTTNLASYFSYDNDSKPDAETSALAGCNKNLERAIASQPSSKGAVCGIDNTFSGAGYYSEASSVKSQQTWTVINSRLEKARQITLAACKLAVGTATCETVEFSNPPTVSAPTSFAAVYATTEIAKESRNAKISTQRQNIRTREENVVSCTNECHNGSCLRTFANGRSERWQAPRVFDPMTNDWKWEINSCGN
jgi:hypothetical protein